MYNHLLYHTSTLLSAAHCVPICARLGEAKNVWLRLLLYAFYTED